MKTTLNKMVSLLGLLGITFAITGCVVSIGGGSRTQNPPPGPPMVVVTDSADAATIAEIDAAARLNMDNDRAQVLSQIAQRATLAVPVQVHLINTTYRCLNFDDSKTQVLRQVIARSDFSDATRHAIVSQLGKLSFDGNRQQVLHQINERLKAAPAQ